MGHAGPSKGDTAILDVQDGAPYPGQDGFSPFFAPDISKTHNCRIFCGLHC